MPDLGTLRDYLQRNRRFLRWKLRHPLGSFESFYVDDVNRRLDAGRPHPTLGVNHRDPALFDATGAAIVAFLQSQGLSPEHRCVDYGCGSLRVGRRLLPLLAPGGYVGMDVTDRFFEDGLSELDAELVRQRRPMLRVISENSLREVATSGIDLIFSIGVVSHIPPASLGRYLRNIWSLTRAGTIVLVQFKDAETLEQTSELTWNHPAVMLRHLLEQHAGSVSVLGSDDLPEVLARPGDGYVPRYLRAVRAKP